VWATRGVRAWEEGWWEMPVSVGNLLAPIIGAPQNSVTMHQNVTIAEAIVLSCFEPSGKRNKIVCEDGNFPSVMYFYAEQKGLRLVTVPVERLAEAIDEETLLVPTSHVLFKTSYLQEIRRYALLTREEEHALAVRYQTDHDVEAAYKLVTGNLRLVVMIAREYQRSFRTLLDLVQEGNIGLMEAMKNFDPYRGVRFPSYAVWWIRAYIIRYVINNWRMVKLGTTQAQRKLFFNLQKEKDRLEREGFVAGPKLLADRLGVKEKEIIEMQQRLGASDLSGRGQSLAVRVGEISRPEDTLEYAGARL